MINSLMILNISVNLGFLLMRLAGNLREITKHEAEAGRMNPDSDIIVTVYLRRNNNTTDEEITKLLLFKESEE